MNNGVFKFIQISIKRLLYIWLKSILSVTPGKNYCIIESMSSIKEFKTSISKLQSEEIERVTKPGRAICQL